MFGCLEGAVCQVRLGTAPGKDAADPIRAIRRRTTRPTRRWLARDIRLSGFYAHLRKDPARRFHDPPQNVAEEIPSQASGVEEHAETEVARRRCQRRSLVA